MTAHMLTPPLLRSDAVVFWFWTHRLLLSGGAVTLLYLILLLHYFVLTPGDSDTYDIFFSVLIIKG